ncbi:class B sortase [Clostridium neonatale]|uniref:class B sortase n=1 Tax=Clostridium neonatale TaxID=137838 RepID=UPI002936E0A4|nr:class B sortase [Clostridium neonatale]
MIGIILCILLGIFMISNPVFHMIKGYIINRDNEEQYIEMDNKEDKSTAVNSEKSKEKKDNDIDSKEILDRYKEILPVNKEVVGWIKFDNSKINYPIAQHSDNEYYLHNDANNNPSIYGSIYLDYRNSKDINDRNNIIYGHNMHDGSMFNDILNLKDKKFFEENPDIYVSNLYKELTWEIFAVYVVDADTETIDVNYATDEEFLDYIKSCEERSLFKRDVNLNKDDKILTLVTCSYETDNSRTIVQAKLIN